jgi:hypothetical protein
MKTKLGIPENVGLSKSRMLRRLCRILDHERETYDIADLVKLSREELQHMINEKVDFPYHRFDS